MSETVGKFGMGWVPDYPDFRDYTPEHEKVRSMLQKARVAGPTKASLPGSADLRAWCAPIENQESLGSCTAQAGVGLVEYFEKRAFGRHIDSSRLFLYKVTRNLLHWTGDTGAFLRTTMGALVLFGVPPEEYWPYVVADFDKEPPTFCYAFAQNYQAIRYLRLDPPGVSKDLLLKRTKHLAAAGFPSMFGFTVYSSISQSSATGDIPYPTAGDRRIGGHAVVAVGYDDNKKIRNANPGNPGAAETKGAFLIRNSWGTGWGSSGYGYLPYDYMLNGLAVDWWTLVRSEWVNTGVFGI